MYKIVINGYILGVGIGKRGTQIGQPEYDAITEVFHNAPIPSEGKGYRLKTDLTWEEYDLPVPSEEDEITDEEAFSIITGESV